MINNYKNIGKDLNVIGIEDNQLLRDPALLKSLIDEMWLITHRESKFYRNILKWVTPEIGYSQTTNLLDGNPRILRFETEEIVGDSAVNSGESLKGWKFINGLQGSYRVSVDIRYELNCLDDTELINYINTLNNETFLGIYLNGTLKTPNMAGVNWAVYDFTNTNLSYTAPNAGNFIGRVHLDEILNINGGVTLDIRDGFTGNSPVSPITITTKGQISINYLGEFKR